MAKLRSINTEFWADEYIGELNRDEKLLFLYFLTNPLTNIAGAYKIARRVIKQDTGFTDAELDVMLARFDQDKKVFYRDGWLFLPNFLKNQSLVGNMPVSALNQVMESPHWIQAKVVETIEKSPKLANQYNRYNDLVLIIKTTIAEYEREREDEKEEEPECKTETLKTENPRPPNGRPSSLPTSIESEVNSWLDATAPLVGAKSRRTMAFAVRWRDAVIIAVKEQRLITDWLWVVEKEVTRNKSSPQFLSPATCLKNLQAMNAKGTATQWM